MFDGIKTSSEDLGTYFGRLRHFQKIISPLNMLHSEAQLREYQKIIDEAKGTQLERIKQKYSDAELWKMKYAVDANIHPQTREIISFPFRTSTFVPVNIPVVFLLSILPPTPLNQVIGQTVNQTYNFLFNYSNRNASNTFTNEQLAFSYVGAVTSALVGSLGSAKLCQVLKLPPFAHRLSPIVGVVLANSFNLYFSRMQDFKNGIDVYDSRSNERLPEKSRIAAQMAFYKTLVVRIVTPLPVFAFPPLLIHLLGRMRMYPSGATGQLLVNSTIAALILYCGLSGAIALFPQYVEVPTTDLERSLQNLRNSQGQVIDSVVFNKGL